MHRDDKYGQHRLGSYFIMTHSSTQTKKKQLEEIARALGIRIRVDITNRWGFILFCGNEEVTCEKPPVKLPNLID